MAIRSDMLSLNTKKRARGPFEIIGGCWGWKPTSAVEVDIEGGDGDCKGDCVKVEDTGYLS